MVDLDGQISVVHTTKDPKKGVMSFVQRNAHHSICLLHVLFVCSVRIIVVFKKCQRLQFNPFSSYYFRKQNSS